MGSGTRGEATPDNRRYVLLRRAAELTRPQMLHHWRTTHATIIINCSEFWQYTSRYLQNQVVGDMAPLGAQMVFDGVVETWQHKRADPYSLFADEAVYHTIVRADERTFLSMTDSVAMLTEAKIIIDGPESEVKVLSFVRRRRELSHEQFSGTFQTTYAELIRTSVQFRLGLVRYVQCVCIPQMERGFAGGKPTYGIDGVVELRFASRNAMSSAFSSDEYRTVIEPEGRRLFLSQTSVHVKELEIHKPAALDGPKS
jgi:EthD domain-containing protein